MAVNQCSKQHRGKNNFTTYAMTWPLITASMKGESDTHCRVCRSDFSVKHNSKHDKKHMGLAKHTSANKIRNANHRVLSFAKSGSAKNKVIQAKCMMTNFIVEHNLPLAMSDHLGKLLPQMFPDSQIVKAFLCHWTKTMHTVQHMAKHHQGELVDLLRKQPFAIMTDDSSGHGVQTQLYPIMVRTFSETSGKIVTQLLIWPWKMGKIELMVNYRCSHISMTSVWFTDSSHQIHDSQFN